MIFNSLSPVNKGCYFFVLSSNFDKTFKIQKNVKSHRSLKPCELP